MIALTIDRGDAPGNEPTVAVVPGSAGGAMTWRLHGRTLFTAPLAVRPAGCNRRCVSRVKPRGAGCDGGWIAFCGGWWLAGIVLGGRHFVGLVMRPATPPLELIGVPLVVGGVLPGAAPVYAAAELRSLAGLPVGFTGMLVGGVIGLTVWVTLPIAIRQDGSRGAVDVPRRVVVLAAIPYVAAGAALGYLAVIVRARGATPRRAAAAALVLASIVYLAGAAVILAVGLVYFD